MVNSGIVKNSDYPYQPKKSNCNTNPKRHKLGLTAYKASPNRNEEVLKNTLANYGPLVVSIYVHNSFFQYHSGIYYEPQCPNNCAITSHAVLLVGYNRSNQPYWIVKNSWGPNWGVQGYIYMIRNQNNNCNVACKSVFTAY